MSQAAASATIGGTQVIHHLLSHAFAQAGIKIGRDALLALLRQARLLVPLRRAYYKTTDSHHRFRRHPNLLKPGEGQVLPCRSEHVWVADITYLPSDERPVYLSLITDAYSHQIVGHRVHDSLNTVQVSQALKKALKGRQTRQTLIHHSDRGIQYCANEYQQIHRQHGLTCLMTMATTVTRRPWLNASMAF